MALSSCGISCHSFRRVCAAVVCAGLLLATGGYGACPVVSPMSNGYFLTNPTRAFPENGDTVEFFCLNDFTLKGSAKLRCNNNMWLDANTEKAPTLTECVPNSAADSTGGQPGTAVTCPTPTATAVMTVQVSNPPLGEGATATFTCAAGYYMMPESAMVQVCRSGRWTDITNTVNPPMCMAAQTNPAITGGARAASSTGVPNSRGGGAASSTSSAKPNTNTNNNNGGNANPINNGGNSNPNNNNNGGADSNSINNGGAVVSGGSGGGGGSNGGIIAGVIIVLLIVAAVAAYFYYKRQQTPASSSTPANTKSPSRRDMEMGDCHAHPRSPSARGAHGGGEHGSSSRGSIRGQSRGHGAMNAV